MHAAFAAMQSTTRSVSALPDREESDRVIDEIEHLAPVESNLQDAAGLVEELPARHLIDAAGILGTQVGAGVVEFPLAGSQSSPVRVVEEFLLDNLRQREVPKGLCSPTAAVTCSGLAENIPLVQW